MPGWLTRFLLRARATLSRGHDRELRDELELHLRLLEEEYTVEGMPTELARQRARREFGNAAQFQEASHDLFSFRLIEDLAGDLRYAVREMRRSAAFTSVAVSSLAVGIAAVTAAFAILDVFLLRALPVREPARLVAFSAGERGAWTEWPYAAFARWQTAPDRLFEAAAAADVRSYDAIVNGTEATAPISVSLVSGNYFRVMGVDAALGRTLTEADMAPAGAPGVAVISHAFWERWFGAAPEVSSRTLDLQGSRYQVIGVAAKGFTGHAVGHPADVWIPLAAQPALMPDGARLLEDRWGVEGAWLRVIARLADGAIVEQAEASATLIRARFLADRAAALGASHSAVRRDRDPAVSLIAAATGHAPERARYGRPVVVLFAIGALVLLVACVNFSNLSLGRSEAREREFVIRLALGGRRWRLLRQAAAECVLLACLAGAIGLLLAHWAATLALEQFAASIVPVEFPLAFDARLLGFATVCVAIAIGFGLWPSTRPARRAMVSSVYQSAGNGSRPRRRAMTNRFALIAQLALCTVLLIAAGLLLRTVVNLRSQDLGFDRDVLLVPLAPGQAGYRGEAAGMLVQRIRERLLAVPGIVAVGLGPDVLNRSYYWIVDSRELTTDRGVVVPGSRWTFAQVGAGFFDAIGLRFVHGGPFDDPLVHPSPEGVVINQSLAALLFGDGNPIGRRVSMGPRTPLRPVVGVVEDAAQTSPRDSGMGVIYAPLRGFERVVLAVRTAIPPSDALPTVRHQLGAIADDVPVGAIRTVAETLDAAIARERLMSAVALVLAALVVAIGCVGLYALLAYEVAQRTREIGIRLALGATKGRVVRLVLREGALLVVPALAIGLPLGTAASRPLTSQLFGVEPGDPWTLAAVALVLTLVAWLATLRPARTASKIDPIVLLRAE